MDALINKFREWLRSASTRATDHHQPSVPMNAQLLMKIAVFVTDNPSDTSSMDVQGCYAEVRSNMILSELQVHFRELDVKGSYKKDTHPLIIGLRKYFELVEAEGEFAAQVLPSALLHNACSRTLKHPSDLIRMSCEAASTKLLKSLAKHEYLEQIWAFNAIEAFTTLFYQKSEAVRLPVKPALQTITKTGVEMLKIIMNDTQDIGRASPPTNATILQSASALISCLKRMLEYESIIEALLQSWSKSDFDGLISEEIMKADYSNGTGVFALALYCQDMLKGIEAAIEKSAQMYKKLPQAILFQLNNYDYLAKSANTSPLSGLLTSETLSKYQTLELKLQQEYLAQWQQTASLLSGGVRSANLSTKECYKVFASELEDLCKNQETCTIPNTQLKAHLLENIRNIVMHPFLTFYNM